MTPFTTIKCLLAFAILVLVPTASPPKRMSFFWMASLSALISLTMDPGLLTAFLAVPWLTYVCVLALDQKKLHSFFLPVGGVWLVLSRLGQNPMGFTEPIVTLTAIHFHYAAFLAPILIRKAEAGKVIPKVVADLSYYGLLLATIVLAAGITVSREVEAAGGVLFALSLSLYALVSLPKARGFLLVSSLSAIVTMALAFLYATIRPFDIAQMAFYHGVLNALGFVGCGLLSWRHVHFHLRGFVPEPNFEKWEARAMTSGLVDESKLFRHDTHRGEFVPLTPFQRKLAMESLLTYKIFPKHRLWARFRNSRLSDGDIVVQYIAFGPFVAETAVKIVRMEPNGFWVATVDGHVERGLEGFLLDDKPEGTSMRIEAHSQPAHWWGWLGLPFVRYLQRKYTREALVSFANGTRQYPVG